MKNGEKILKGLEDRELSSIEFIRDYLQLRFDGPQLNIMNRPKILVEENKWVFDHDKEFSYYLIKCIGEKVKKIRFEEGSFFEMQFRNGLIFVLPMRPEDYIDNSPEALLYWSSEGKLLAVW